MSIEGDNPAMRREVGEALAKVIGKEVPDLSHRTMTDDEKSELKSGQTQELVENELKKRGYTAHGARMIIERTWETFIF